MLTLSDEYVAGLFDGEGWFHINIAHPKGCRNPTYQVSARLGMREEIIIRSLQEMFGGSVRERVETDKHAAYFEWNVTGENAYAFASRIGPRMQVKRTQAMLCIMFQEYKRENKNQPNGWKRVLKMTGMYEQMKELNRKGVSRRI